MLTRKTKYAIRALVYIQLKNWEKKRPGVTEIATKIEAPKAFSGKILQTLTKHKFLVSMKGRGGGYFFNNNQSNITLNDLVDLMEGDSSFNQCVFGLVNCNAEDPCPIHGQYIEVRDRFNEIIQTETIRSLAERIRNGSAVLNRIVQKNKNL